MYVGEGLPEIIVPRTQRIDDYAFVVGRLIEEFSKVADTDPLIIYQDLVNADRDVIRVRVPEADGHSLPVEQGVGLVSSARDLLLAAACSLEDRRPVYRVGSNQSATEYLRRVRLGHTEQGSFAVTLLPPVVPPEVETQGRYDDGDRFREEPLERRMTGHFANTLSATKSAAEETASGSVQAFASALASGASANFCEAMVSLIGPFPELEVSVSWALTRPVASRKRAFTFFQDESPILRAASESFRARGPKHDVRLFGKVGRPRPPRWRRRWSYYGARLGGRPGSVGERCPQLGRLRDGYHHPSRGRGAWVGRRPREGRSEVAPPESACCRHHISR